MQHINLITRRGFLDRATKIGLGLALSTLTDIPFVMKKALAEGTIGTNGKKLLFIFLRGGMDGLNTVIPMQDSSYAVVRPSTPTGTQPVPIGIPGDPATIYSTSPIFFPTAGGGGTYDYQYAIPLGNTFAALHPSLKFLVPVYTAGDLAILHRVGYPKQSRSHFDSQIYWENGSPNNGLIKDGIFYRTLLESGLAGTSPLTGVSIQSSLPLSLRGSAAAMTNLADPTRYNLFGIPNDTFGNNKADQYTVSGNNFPFPSKAHRDLLRLQYQNLTGTLSIFAGLNFSETGNTFVDGENTDGDVGPYHLFPTVVEKNGGYQMNGDNPAKYVVDNTSSAYSFFKNLKSAAMVLNHTDAIIAGTELGSFDTHSAQGQLTGTMPNLQRRLAWAIYALRKYFTIYHDKVDWNNLVVVTLSEFGRKTLPNGNAGTDHAEAGVMLVAGGGINGGNFGCRANEFIGGNAPLNWVPGPTGSMFGVQGTYLKRIFDYRSILGEIIRDHLGATQNQLNRIIPGYANASEKLLGGGVSGIDNTQIVGEAGLI